MPRRVGRSVGLAAACAATVIAAFVAGKAARDAILLANFAVTSLPMFVAIAAAISIPLVLVVGRLMVRFGPVRLVVGLNVASAALLAGEWLVFQSAPDVAATITFFHLSAFGAVLVSAFWSVVNERFDARTAKRHIGRIGMAATIGGIAGGLIAERVAVYLEPGMILLVIAALQIACAGFGVLLGEGPATPAVDDDRAGWSALRHVAGSSLLRTLALVLVLDAIAATALDFIFKVEVTTATTGEDRLRLFALFYGGASVVTAIVQLTAARFAIEKLGVTRGIATLPAMLTFAGLGTLAVPGLAAATIARGSEMITRSTIYRVGYELVYTPLLEHQKRSTKVVLDVGVERIGDLLGAQLVALLIYVAPAPRAWLAGSIVAAGIVALVLAARLRSGYKRELERSLRSHVPDVDSITASQSFQWQTLTELGDLTAMSLLDVGSNGLADRVAALQSDDPNRVRAALVEPLPPELAAIAVPLLGRDDFAGAASAALRTIAPQCTGVLADALFDARHAVAIRRRIPPILEEGDPEHARWALWRGLSDPELAVRVRCGRALARLGGTERPRADVFALVKHELAVADRKLWQTQIDDDDTGLDHVFTLLGLVLPDETLRIARHALDSNDDKLRATALEYLESVMPADVFASLGPVLDAPAPSGNPRAPDALESQLILSRERILEEVARRQTAGIDWDANRSAIKEHKAALRKLFEAKQTPDLAGRYVLRLTIAPSGTIVSAEVTQHPSAPGVEQFKAAIVAEASGWQFANTRSEVVVNYPFVFEAR